MPDNTQSTQQQIADLVARARANGSESAMQDAVFSAIRDQIPQAEFDKLNLTNLESAFTWIASNTESGLTAFREMVTAGENLLTIGLGFDIFKSSNLPRKGDVQKFVFPFDLLDNEGSNGTKNSSRIEIDIIGNSNRPELTDTIALYMPPDIQARYSARWQDDALGGMAGAATEIMGGLGQISSNASQGASNVASGIRAIDATVFGNVRQRGSRSIVNPHKALLYQSHDFRTISIEWQLFARSPEESGAIHNLIKRLKEASHSGVGGEGVALGTTFEYPDEMILRFYSTGKSNAFMFNFGPCVITNLTARYGPGQASFFIGTGAPVQVDLSIEFQEIFMLTKDHIRQNY